MSKEDFLDQLAYGTCNGSVELVSPRCIEGSPGKKPAPCPVKVAEGRGEIKYCNCCEKCRANCNWVAQIKEVTKRESKKRLREMREMTEYLDNE